MDSVTQAVLGASMGEIVLGKKAGNKALLWGAIAGTIPDLDVLSRPFLDTVDELLTHRAFSHSILFWFLGSLFFGWITHFFLKNKNTISLTQWIAMYFLAFSTHALLDTCTTWGTQLLYPFSHYGYATYSVFVVDPFYTLPFLLLLLIILFLHRENQWRSYLNLSGLILSTAYLIWGLAIQSTEKDIFLESLKNQKNITPTKTIVKATPFNTFLWAMSAIDQQGNIYTGYHSIFDDDNNIKWQIDQQNKHLLLPIEKDEDIQNLLAVTKGFFTIQQFNDHQWELRDLRFGVVNGWEKEAEKKYAFQYPITKKKDGVLEILQKGYRENPSKEFWKMYLDRVLGKKQ